MSDSTLDQSRSLITSIPVLNGSSERGLVDVSRAVMSIMAAESREGLQHVLLGVTNCRTV